MEAAATGNTRACPYCAEVVLLAAVKCKHCRSDLLSSPAADKVKQRGWKLGGALVGTGLAGLLNGFVAVVAFASLSSATDQAIYERGLETALVHAGTALVAAFALAGLVKLQRWAAVCSQLVGGATAFGIGYMAWGEWPSMSIFAWALGLGLAVFGHLTETVFKQLAKEQLAAEMAAAAASIEPPAAA